MSKTRVVQKGSEHWLCQKKKQAKKQKQKQRESERKINSDRYPAIVQQVVQQQVNTLTEALDSGKAF